MISLAAELRAIQEGVRVAGENGKEVHELFTDNRTAWGMLQDSSLHRVVERVRGGVAELNMSRWEIGIT